MVLAALLFVLADEPSDLQQCLSRAKATRPAQHCYSVEIERRDGVIFEALTDRIRDKPDVRPALDREQDAWDSEMRKACFFNMPRRGSLGSMRAMQCRLEAQEERLTALGVSVDD